MGLASAQTPGPAESGTVLVTGSNRGLGIEFARQYAARGWTVIATVRTPQSATELQALAAQNTRITIEKLDLLDAAAIKALAAKYEGKAIDVVVNKISTSRRLANSSMPSSKKSWLLTSTAHWRLQRPFASTSPRASTRK
jgi:NAD(P)-dependent dehydrogenase (short-subunit alcohol dehydrogenase family)